MYAGTRVNWHEVLMGENTPSSNNDALPLFLCAFSADKGSEAITDFTYSDFKKMYGDNADFFKYGQPLIQAHKILAAGGRVLGKRIVAEDAKLANLIITAEISTVEVAKLDAAGNPVYLDAAGNPTSEVTDKPAKNSVAKIKYSSYTVADADKIESVEAYTDALLAAGKYPLFIICDNGRGKSIKKVRIFPDYDTSKRMTYMLYKIFSIENTTTVESQRFAVKPDAVAVVNGTKKSYLLNKSTMTQMKAEEYVAGMDAFVKKLSDVTGYGLEDLYGFDILFGKTVKGKHLDLIKIDTSGIDINTEYGLELTSGTNGVFGDKPFPGEEASAAWTEQAIKFFNGSFSDEIFDLDQHKIDFCVDANYPDTVKAAICELADFREDFYFFRDLGLKITGIGDIQEKLDSVNWLASPFAGDYESSYEIIENFSHKQIRVTMTHGLAPLLVNHYLTNPAAPVAGEFNNFIITEAIPGTLNFIPRVTPSVDQKELLDEMKVNFANYGTDNMLAIQSTYTSQDHDGPLSYSSNVIITQMVIKEIRRYCPKIRFMLMDAGSTDFGKYKTLIEDNVISKYVKHFKSISLVYTRDDEQVANKIFNASLYCYYRDFPQAEVFDVFAVEGSPDSNPIG